MRIRVTSIPPLQPCQVWHVIETSLRVGQYATATLANNLDTGKNKSVANVLDLKWDLCNCLPVLANLDVSKISLSIDGFELLDGSPIGVVHEGDLVCVSQCSVATTTKRRRSDTHGNVARKRPRQSQCVHTPWELDETLKSQNIGNRDHSESSSESSSTSSSSSSSSDSEESSSSNSDSDSDSDTNSDDETSSCGSSSNLSTPSVIPTRYALPTNKRSSPSKTKIPSTTSAASTEKPPPVPPGLGKATTHSRNARRKRKRQLERANSLADIQQRVTVSHNSSNAVPLRERRAGPPMPMGVNANVTHKILEEGVTRPTTVDFDVSKLDSSLQNKNKRRGFSRLSTTLAVGDIAVPRRIVFEDAQHPDQSPNNANGTTPTRAQAQTRPRLVRPSERAERGELPDNLFVTSVEVEKDDDGKWNRKRKKKKRDEYGYDELDEDGDVTLDYGKDEAGFVRAGEGREVSLKNTLGTIGDTISVKEWGVIEKKWDSGTYKNVSGLDDLKEDGVVGFTEVDINPATCTPEVLMQLARVIQVDARNDGSNDTILIRRFIRPGLGVVGFGSRGVNADEQVESEGVLEEGEEMEVPLKDVVSAGWKVVRSDGVHSR